MGVFDRTDHLAGAGHEQVVFCQDQASGLKAIIAVCVDGAGTLARRHAVPPVRDEDDALADVLKPFARDGLQGGRAPASTSAAARPSSSATRPPTRPRRSCAPSAASSRASAAATTRPATSAPTSRTWTSSPASRASSPAARRERRRRRQRRAHRLRRLPGHARRGAAHLGRPDPVRPPGRRRGRRQGRPPPRRAPARGRRLRRHQRRRRRRRRSGPRRSAGRGRRRRGAAHLRPRRLRALRPRRLADRRPASPRCRPTSSAAPRTTSSPSRRGEGRWPTAAPLRPRLRRQRRRAGPGRRRGAAGAPGGFRFERAQAMAAPSSTPRWPSSASPTPTAYPPAVAADRLAERRMADVGRLRTSVPPGLRPTRRAVGPEVARAHGPCTVEGGGVAAGCARARPDRGRLLGRSVTVAVHRSRFGTGARSPCDEGVEPWGAAVPRPSRRRSPAS